MKNKSQRRINCYLFSNHNTPSQDIQYMKEVNGYYDSGELHFRFFLLNDLKHGICQEFYPNAVLKQSGVFEYGCKISTWFTYSEYGHIVTADIYDNNENIIAHERNFGEELVDCHF